ncbi:molybdate ABC transporter substrate-binding protein [Permianibacter sp. IMCC34836]|uniref:molybdate ABC transporter substrate-binding protein n=1 Tax=Permianibacter fluminis TaxID=2738515 RepID=UPI0015546158|nr:molybdate ABC transporter substrate-binding protein [Permianibacter fluminis]NQD36711.1 molybdate ABC transporter substrate-binding protein [Permianibacter fluminis]
MSRFTGHLLTRGSRAALFGALLLISALPFGRASAGTDDSLSVAVAANLQGAFTELASAFEKETGIVARGSFGATGKLSTQIRQGAPFHLLLAADSDYPKALHSDGFALLPPRPYAIGTLIVWTTRELPIDDWQALLRSERVQHIAIANPDTAPYGREAARALQHFQLLRDVQTKLVYGESIGQTSQFIVSGAADIGFTAKSVVIAQGDAVPGQWREVAADSYAPIVQSAVLLRYAEGHERARAERFYAFLFSPTARAIFQRYGYLLP